MHLAGPEPAGGKPEHARAAAIVDDPRAALEMRIEILQAQRGARVRAGAESEPGVERHYHGVGIDDPLVARADPQPPPEAQRVKVLEPLALPGAIGQRRGGDRRGLDAE